MKALSWTLISRGRIDADRRECRERHNPSSQSPEAQNAYFDCLREKGWDDESKTSRELRRLTIEDRKICLRPEHTEVVKNISCRASDIGLEHLSNMNRVDPRERQQYIKFFEDFEATRKEAMNLLKNGSMRDRKMFEHAAEGAPKIDSIRVALITGEITFGEYSRRRKEIETERQRFLLKANEEYDAFIKAPPPQIR